MYKLTKTSAVKARTQAINQLKSVLITADPALREELSGLGNAELCRTCARFAQVSGHEEAGEKSVLQATRITLGWPAHRIGQGIGPDTAVTLLITVGDNPERLDTEASFAALCGASPVERSSGRRQFRRLNRGGDRQANAALHRIVQTRLRVDPRTQDYYERRSKEGKTRREIVRSLKRYAAREVFHLVRPVQPQPSSQGQCDRRVIRRGPAGVLPVGTLRGALRRRRRTGSVRCACAVRSAALARTMQSAPHAVWVSATIWECLICDRTRHSSVMISGRSASTPR
ncbi:IS110 family transposase [Streptomyces sp. FXJ1.172]|nr:IS110 family transposase [Streptomyces sp. FXJ1.172]WEO93187.1 IS110 family transposase [Streptomyces sp. FXJ1.172]